MALLLNLDNILLLLAGVSIAVAWHRLMILNEQPGFSGGNVASKNLWRYIVVALALFLVMLLPMAAVMLPTFYFLQPVPGPARPPSGFFLLLPLGFTAYAVGTAVAFRLTLLLPARAIGDTSLTFKQTWNRTRGNVWRLFWGVVVTTMPALLIAQVVFLIGVGVAQMTAMSTVFAVYYLLILPIGIGFLSHAYRHFFVAPLELP
jgi:membrane-anchored glycerophosphoryl diester phosphodiesterase (GDPDase)